MLDFNHILSTPGYDFQQFYGTSSVTLLQWQTWRKPRGVKFIYLIGVGGGGSGSVGGRAQVTAGGGGGGGSGGQTAVLMPAAFVPDTLYVQCGQGGASVNTVALAGTAGQPTYVSIEPSTTLTPLMTVLLALGGAAGGAEATGGSPGGAGGTLATIAGMPLAGRGQYTFFVGQTGGTGGTRAGGVPTAIAVPTTGLMVTGGQSGGAGGTTPTAGAGFAAVTGALGGEFFNPIAAGAVATGATPATAGNPGYIVKNYILNYGGAGGGGSDATTGGIAGAGGDGAPGCGGGGAGGSNTTNATVAPAGRGGDGFVYIISW